MTKLTWCEECGKDMHEVGGKDCSCGCKQELCFSCIHKQAPERSDDDDNDNE